MLQFNSSASRPTTNKLIEMMDEGIISAREVAEMALGWLSEDDVKGMCRANDQLEVFSEEVESSVEE